MRGGRDKEGVRAWVRIATRADWGRVGFLAIGRNKILNDVVAKPERFIHRLLRCSLLVHSFAHLGPTWITCSLLHVRVCTASRTWITCLVIVANLSRWKMSDHTHRG